MNNRIGNNLKILLKKLEITQSEIASEYAKKVNQSWVAKKLGELGNNEKKLTSEQTTFIQRVLEIVNAKIKANFQINFNDIIALDFGTLTHNEINNEELSLKETVNILLERQKNLEDKINNTHSNPLQLEKKILTQKRQLIGLSTFSFLMFFLLLFFCKCENDGFECTGKDDGKIFFENYAKTPREIHLCGQVCGNSSKFIWLFLLKKSSGKIERWPKGRRIVTDDDRPGHIKPDQYGNWCDIFYEYGSEQDTIFDLELRAVDTIGHLDIQNWLDTGFVKQNEAIENPFPAFQFSDSAKHYLLDVVNDIEIIQSRKQLE